ncbi:MAG: hypothetical protein Q8K89_05640 [Actinomycetota bacterium]|nr:hypothetical protein [Actinomycetota bacterium]
MNAESIPEDRPISAKEAALVSWLLLNAQMGCDTAGRSASVDDLRVVGRCSCGCPSVDFVENGQGSGAFPIASAYGTTVDGVVAALVVWEREGVISGLELCELDEPVRSLPLIDTLTMMSPF